MNKNINLNTYNYQITDNALHIWNDILDDLKQISFFEINANYYQKPEHFFIVFKYIINSNEYTVDVTLYVDNSNVYFSFFGNKTLLISDSLPLKIFLSKMKNFNIGNDIAF